MCVPKQAVNCTSLMKLFVIIFSFLTTAISITNTRLLIISARGGKCHYQEGDYLMSLFQKGMTDYCNRHSYTFSFHTEDAFPSLPGHWNKIGQLIKAMRSKSITKYQWIMWIDNDTLVCQPETPINFDLYNNYDFVIHGNPQEFGKGEKEKIDMYKALNSGIMLLKVGDGALKFLLQIAQFAQWSWEEKKMKLEGGYLNFENIQDQAVITYLVHQSIINPNEFGYLKIYIEPNEYLNGFWERYQGGKAQSVLFKHWAGCKFCERSLQLSEHRAKCIADFTRDYERIFGNQLIDNFI